MPTLRLITVSMSGLGSNHQFSPASIESLNPSRIVRTQTYARSSVRAATVHLLLKTL
jgi:hypothetical protein